MSYTIRDLTTYEEMLAVHRLQQDIWEMADPTVGLYPSMLWSVSKNGGVVLGAFDEADDSLVAFLFSYIGREADGFIKLYSQIMGVRREWRSHGIGEALKRVQCEHALRMGLTLINWTYDPLEAPNARLNIGKLRAISRTYMRDIYGSTMGALNAGLPTDRLLVEWWIAGEWLDQPHHLDDPHPVFVTEVREGRRVIQETHLDLDAPRFALEIPISIQTLKRVSPEAALDWRIQTRIAFETLFARGYAITDFSAAETEACYILEKLTPELSKLIGIRA